MKDDPLVARAVQALKLLGSDSDHARKRVEYAIRGVERQKHWKSTGHFGTWTVAQKDAAKRFAVALRKLEVALADPDLALDAQPALPFDHVDLKIWIRRAAEAANKNLVDGKNPHRPDQAKLTAAREALALLKAHGLPATLTINGNFCRLAAILFGAPNSDFRLHCRKARAADLSRPHRREPSAE